MRSLVLVRHAKSDWGTANLADHDRPLNDRGRRDAPVMASRLAASGFIPDLILTSTALRAATTAATFAAEWDVAPHAEEKLYGASPAEILRTVAEHPESTNILLVAHDPGLTMLATSLVPEIPGMPTCAVARFVWNDAADWHVVDAVAPDDWSFDSPR